MSSLRLIHADAVSALQGMPDASVDMILTNPPVAIHVDEKFRTSEVRFPNPHWIHEALRVSRGPVVYTLSPEFVFTNSVAKIDLLLCWMIDSEKDYAPGRGFSSDFNLICVHRPGSIRVSSSDVFLAKPGFPVNLIDDPTLRKRQDHPAPGSSQLADKLCGIWKPRTILDPFCGPCASLEGALLAANRGGWNFEGIGIDIDMEYLEAAGTYFEARRGATVTYDSRHPDTALRVGR